MTAREGRGPTRVLLAIAAVLCGWAFLLGVTGGFDLPFVTAHNPVRPLLSGCLALAAHVALTRKVTRGAGVQLSARVATAIAIALAVAAGAVTYVYGAKVAGGSDSWGYLSEAALWLSGRLGVDHAFAREAPWPDALRTFTPLAYRPTDQWSIVPFVSPGLPAFLAVAKWAGGASAMFSVVPFFGAMLVFATYAIAARVASPAAGLAAAWFVATSPIVLYMSAVVMSDVPAASLFALGFVGLLRATPAWAAASGLFTGLAVAVRPNLALLMPVLALRHFGSADVENRFAVDVRRRSSSFLWFAAGLMPGLLGLAAFNQVLNGSPVTSGYQNLSDTFRISHLLPNFLNDLRWVVDTQTWLFLLGLGALAVRSRLLWPSAQPRVLTIAGLVVVVLALFYGLYTVFDAWTYLRFLLPAWPLAMTGLGAVAAWLMTSQTRAVAAVALTAAVTLGLVQLRLAESHGVFTVQSEERRYVEAGQLAATLTEPSSVLVSMQHSGSLRYYGGRMTLRYDALDPAWADRAVDWLSSRGVRTYIVADDWELPDIERRFAGTRIAEAITRPPRAVVGQPAAVLLFDVTALGDLTNPPALLFPR